jgi:glycosyltransferase involved in cell wall biosynthesis
MEGYKAALEEELEIIVKLDGDGQMDPTLLPELVAPIVDGYADYAKGNRFYNLERISKMPKARIFGNALLSFLTKLSAGYWDIFDPTNGYTAIHWKVAQELPFEKISQRYFFESDMLFRLNTVRAVVVDVPMDARYGAESSGLSIRKILPGFAARHFANFVKRLFYNYYLRDMSVASIQLPFGILMTVLGVVYGGASWIGGIQRDVPSLPGTVTLSALLIIVGTQLILAFLGYDIASVPRNPIHKRLHMRGGGLK